MQQIKNEITAYWNGRAEKFETLRLRELKSAKRERWLCEIEKYLPDAQGLRILDIGTGTGFFCFLLAQQGQRMTGIDLSEEMIRGARHSAGQLGLDADFFVMDAEAPAFAPESFDAILTRNLTSFLPDLGRAYQNWYGLLKKGGVLLNFDADYHHETVQTPLPANHAHKELTQAQNQVYAHISAQMARLQRARPQWDLELLRRAGFKNVQVDRGVWGRIYAEIDEFYNPVPIFAIAARK